MRTVFKIIKNVLLSYFYILIKNAQGSKISPSVRFISGKGGFTFTKSITLKSNCRIDLSKGSVICGSNIWVNQDVEISPNIQISIGSHTTIQKRVTINGRVEIGSNVIIAPNVFISSGTHIFDYAPELPIREQEALVDSKGLKGDYERAVVIGDDVWIGINVVILPGVKIGSHVVIGANSVVTKDVESGTIVAGAPEKFIKKRM